MSGHTYDYKQRAQKNNRVGNCDTCKYRNTCLMKWTEKRCIQSSVTVKFPYNKEDEKIKKEIARKVRIIKAHKEKKERGGK